MSGPFYHTQHRPFDAEGRRAGSGSRAIGLLLLLLLPVAGILTCDWITGPENQPPTALGTIPDQIVEVDSAVTVDLADYFSDPEGDSLAYTALLAAPGTAAVALSGSVVAVTGVAKGETSVTATATDPEGLTATQSFAVMVPNRAPVVADTIAGGEVYVDSILSIEAAAYFTDPDGDDLEYSATSSDTARVAAAVSGSTVTVTGVGVGSTMVTVTARDPGGLAVEQSFGVTVPNRAPVAVGTIEDRVVEVDSAFALDVAQYFADPDRDSLVYAATLPDTARVALALSESTLTLTGVARGSVTVTVTARDPWDLVAEQGFGVTVPNRPPVSVDAVGARELYVGDAIEIDVTAHFTDPDGDVLDYAAATSDTTRAVVLVVGGVVTVTGVAVGNATVTVTAGDPEGLSAEQAFEVTLPNRQPEPLGAIEDRDVYVGDTVAVDVAAYFTEPDGEALEYAAASSSAATAAVDVSGSTVTVVGVAVGEAVVTVTARDPHGERAEQTLAVTVPSRAPEAVGTIGPRVVRAGSAITVDVAAHFTDPDGDLLRYFANSSDPSRATVSMSGSLLTVTGVAGGHATVRVTARDSAGLAARQSFQVTVPNRAPETVGTIGNRAVERNKSLSLDVSPYFSDPDGDALEYGATSSNTTLATVTVSGSTITIAGRRAGTVTISVAARDPGSLTATQSFRLRVVQGNRTPQPVGTIPDGTLEAGGTLVVNVSSYFSDPDGDELDYDANSSNTAVATATIAGSALTVLGVDEGDATITVTATDPGGLSTHQRFEVTVEPAPPSDLVVGPPSANPNVLGPGESFTLNAIVHNQGAGPASSGTTLRYYRSADATIGTDDSEIGTDEVPHLRPSASSVQSLPVTAPSGFGTYYYGACADAVDNESSATNNCSSAVEVRVTPSNRAPRAVGTIPDRTLDVGDDVSVDAAPYFTDPDGDNLTYAASSSNTGVATVTRSGSTISVTGESAGGATITVTATDPGGLSATQQFDVTVNAPAESDLVVLSPAADPDELGPGETFTLSAVVHNQGAGETSSSTTLRYYRSSDATISTGDTQIGADAVAQLGPSQSSAESLSVTAPSSQGTYHYGACVDAVDNESSTTNNCSSAVEVEVARPNQAPRAVGTIPDETITLTDEVSVDAAPYFTDPDNDDLDYTAESSSTTVATVVTSASEVKVKGAAVGRATITVTATDPGGLSATQSFDVEVEDIPNRAPAVTNELADLANIVPGERFTAYLPDVFTDPDDDDLAWSTSSTNIAAATAAISGDSVVVTAVAAGSATVTVTAADPDNLTATDTFEVEVVANRFDIDLYFDDDIANSYRSYIRAARDRWESILAATELYDVTYSFTVTCHGATAPSSTLMVDDHAILIRSENIDGAGGTYAYAGYCYTRAVGGTPVVSTVVFDNADIGRVSSSGNLQELAFHEFGHGLGFLNAYWERHDLIETGSDPHFTGALAVEAFDSAGGTSYPGNKVPTSSTTHSHWRESELGREGMTPIITRWVENPFSAISLQAMADVGYEVDASLADDYQLPNTAPPDLVPDGPWQLIDLTDDVIQGPVMVVDGSGRVIRIDPAPPGSVLPSFGRQVVHLDRRERDGPGIWVRYPPGRRLPGR